MASPEGQLVKLILVTGDDTLADSFIEDIDEREIDNPVTRLRAFHEAIDYLSGTGEDSNENLPVIVILDVRDAVREGTRFLNEVHNRFPFSEPVILIIGAGENEAEFIKGHERYIAGQLPAIGAVAAFVEWSPKMLSSSWSFEKTPDR